MSTDVTSPEELPIGEVARRAGTAPSTVRYYERVGLLPTPGRQSGRRRYGEDAVKRLEVIAVAKAAGFSLAEIERLLNGFPRETTPGERWEILARSKLAELDALAERIDEMRDLLTRGIGCGCRSLEDCGIFAAERERRRLSERARAAEAYRATVAPRGERPRRRRLP